ncbi:MAG: radical SAM protein, partial [Spirochaetes bacterium]|nr:radical SAM protein [Spirochaetota bacterium]
SNRRLQNKTGNKTTNRDFRKAVAFLREAGYKKKDIGVYIMAGLPGQTAKNVEASINFVYDSGASPFLSYFSPIPGTKIWPESVLSNTFLVEKEPLLQNNTVFILGNKNFSEQAIQHLKDISTELRLKTLTL